MQSPAPFHVIAQGLGVVGVSVVHGQVSFINSPKGIQRHPRVVFVHHRIVEYTTVEVVSVYESRCCTVGFITPPTRRSKGVLSSVTSRYLSLASHCSRGAPRWLAAQHINRAMAITSFAPTAANGFLAGCRHSTDTRSSHPVSSPSAVSTR